MPNRDIDNSQDVLDVRDIIARVEELEEARDAFVIGSPDGEETPAPEQWARENEQEAEELATLSALLEDMKGNGGDEEWRGDWYPVTLIRDDYFEEYMDEMIADCYDLDALKVPSFVTLTIDYKALQMDYTSTEFDGVTYWYR